MTARLVIALTEEDLAAVIHRAVRRALDEERQTQEMASEEMTLQDVMTLFKVRRRQTIWAWRRERGFPAPHRRGGLWRYLRTQVDEWRAAQGTSGPGTITEPTRRRPREARAAVGAH